MDKKNVTHGGLFKMDILVIAGMVGGIIITIFLQFRESQRICNINEQRAKEMEMVRYHFWLVEVGLTETAYMFNEFGISVSRGEEV